MRPQVRWFRRPLHRDGMFVLACVAGAIFALVELRGASVGRSSPFNALLAGPATVYVVGVVVGSVRAFRAGVRGELAAAPDVPPGSSDARGGGGRPVADPDPLVERVGRHLVAATTVGGRAMAAVTVAPDPDQGGGSLVRVRPDAPGAAEMVAHVIEDAAAVHVEIAGSGSFEVEVAADGWRDIGEDFEHHLRLLADAVVAGDLEVVTHEVDGEIRRTTLTVTTAGGQTSAVFGVLRRRRRGIERHHRFAPYR